MSPSFEDWMDRVCSLLEAQCDVDVDDIPDWDWRDAYDAGMSPGSALNQALTSMGLY